MENNSEVKTIREPLFHIVKRDSMPWWKSWLIHGAAIILALIVTGFLVAIVLKKNPFEFYSSLFSGVFETPRRLNKFIRDTSMLLIISLALTPAFKMRFWNIGAEGQVLIGALASVACMFYLGGKIPEGLLLLIMFVSSILASAIWAFIPAIFKSIWNTNETLFTLMMNYIATQIVLFMIKIWVTSGSGVLNPLPHGHLPEIAGDECWLIAMFAGIITVLMYVYLKYSKHGYELTVVGESENTARYIGINVKKVVMRTLILSGVICGIAGFLFSAAINYCIAGNTVGGLGFTAILVAWLGKLNPVIMIFTSALVVFLQRGASQAMTDFHVTNDFFSDIVIGIMFFFIIACEFFIVYKLKFRNKKKDTVNNDKTDNNSDSKIEKEEAK